MSHATNSSWPTGASGKGTQAYFTFPGGAWFSRVSNAGLGFDGVSTHDLDHNATVPPGYIFQANGAMDIDGPVPVTPTSWGRVKALYR